MKLWNIFQLFLKKCILSDPYRPQNAIFEGIVIGLNVWNAIVDVSLSMKYQSFTSMYVENAQD